MFGPPRHSVFSFKVIRSPATDKAWENNSLPIGNGSLGGNVMGSIAAERITLNEKTLWRGGPNTEKGAAYYWNVNKESAQADPLEKSGTALRTGTLQTGKSGQGSGKIVK